MANKFTDISDLLRKKDNEEAREEIESSGVPQDECLSADEFVGKIVKPIQELQSDAKKNVKSVKFNSSAMNIHYFRNHSKTNSVTAKRTAS